MIGSKKCQEKVGCGRNSEEKLWENGSVLETGGLPCGCRGRGEQQPHPPPLEFSITQGVSPSLSPHSPEPQPPGASH